MIFILYVWHQNVSEMFSFTAQWFMAFITCIQNFGVFTKYGAVMGI